ncbi:hypothetical protein GTO27_00440 [Candidatus Bathyarchaeota archaeon]|nr:hypothetical protein [Candidatus Bathyarchaeota archaeon]
MGIESARLKIERKENSPECLKAEYVIAQVQTRLARKAEKRISTISQIIERPYEENAKLEARDFRIH